MATQPWQNGAVLALQDQCGGQLVAHFRAAEHASRQGCFYCIDQVRSFEKMFQGESEGSTRSQGSQISRQTSWNLLECDTDCNRQIPLLGRQRDPGD